MSQKMTDSEKWDDPWFSELSKIHKVIYIYLCDRCDCAGLWTINLKTLTFHTGATEDDWREFVAAAGEHRVQFIGNDQIWLLKYIPFQIAAKGFHPDNNVVKGVWTRLNQINAPVELLPSRYAAVLDLMNKQAPYQPLQAPYKPLEGDKDKDKKRDKEQKQGKGRAS